MQSYSLVAVYWFNFWYHILSDHFASLIHSFFPQILIKHLFYNRCSEHWGCHGDQCREIKSLPHKMVIPVAEADDEHRNDIRCLPVPRQGKLGKGWTVMGEWHFRMDKASLSEEIFWEETWPKQGGESQLSQQEVSYRQRGKNKDPESRVASCFQQSARDQRAHCPVGEGGALLTIQCGREDVEGRGQVMDPGGDGKPLELSFQCHKLNPTQTLIKYSFD